MQICHLLLFRYLGKKIPACLLVISAYRLCDPCGGIKKNAGRSNLAGSMRCVAVSHDKRRFPKQSTGLVLSTGIPIPAPLAKLAVCVLTGLLLAGGCYRHAKWFVSIKSSTFVGFTCAVLHKITFRSAACFGQSSLAVWWHSTVCEHI